MFLDESKKYCPIDADNKCDSTCAWWSEGQEGCSVAGIDVLLEIINGKFDELLKVLDDKYGKKKK